MDTKKTNYKREDYLNGKCTHSQYYDQYVTEYIKNIVRIKFTIRKLIEASQQEKELNSIPLAKWDSLMHYTKYCKTKLQENGDSYTMATSVCILKAAARQLIKEHK